MKAFILAAGLGTRLRPYTEHTPKPLFPVGGRPLIDRLIHQLEDNGFKDIAINLHHLAGQVEHYINQQDYQARITLLHEPEILGTGGGIKNLGAFWTDTPLLVINGDIFTDIDLRAAWENHLDSGCPATLVVHDRAEFNTVTMTNDNHILSFVDRTSAENKASCLAFTGIQVIEREFIDFCPDHSFFSSISVYQAMIDAGRKVKAYPVRNHRWEDIGSPDRYLTTVSELLTRDAFKAAFDRLPEKKPLVTRLQGDGSDRVWSRITDGADSLVAVSHGIRSTTAVCESDAFINIGRHLHRRGLPVPELYAADPFAGLAILEDLGDRHLQDAVLALDSTAARIRLYQKVIDTLVTLSREGAVGFNPAWPYQTQTYNREVILQNECAYFVEAFLHLERGYEDVTFNDLREEFELLADRTLANGVIGFMHRDFQSRNIMLRGEQCVVIDFQGGRLGPVQYDLASLLIDPYVRFTPEVQAALRDYGLDRIQAVTGDDRQKIQRGYVHCSLTRNLQILGAFGFLSRKKNKPGFAAYIPTAVAGLKLNLAVPEADHFPKLREVVERL